MLNKYIYILFIHFNSYWYKQKYSYNIAFEYKYTEIFNKEIIYSSSICKTHSMCSEKYLSGQIFTVSVCNFWCWLFLHWGQVVSLCSTTILHLLVLPSYQFPFRFIKLKFYHLFRNTTCIFRVCLYFLYYLLSIIYFPSSKGFQEELYTLR